IDGKPARVRTVMSVRLVAKPLPDNNFDVRIAAADFGAPGEDEFVSTGKPLRRPRYPEQAAMSGVRGTVYVIVRVGRDGKVQDAMAEQVNLRVVDTESEMNRWRDMLADATLATARKWTFVPPTKGEEVDAPFWLARVPVDYQMPNDEAPRPGRWEAYIPGPRQSAPWLGGMDTSLGADAVAGGGIFPLQGGPRLLTPLDGG
ncbi:MAG TPA: energy transducer TonB, partial [Lysobacter sp.]